MDRYSKRLGLRYQRKHASGVTKRLIADGNNPCVDNRRFLVVISRRSFAKLVDDLLLVDVFEDVGSVNEEIDGPTESHAEKDVQLEAIDDQSHVLPVLLHLNSKA